jgi:hypothetical protein
MLALPAYACMQEGETAVYAAAEMGRLRCLKELLARGGAVDQADKVRSACLCPAQRGGPGGGQKRSFEFGGFGAGPTRGFGSLSPEAL